MTEKNESCQSIQKIEVKQETHDHIQNVVKQIVEVYETRTYDTLENPDDSIKAYFDWMLTKTKLNYGNVVDSVLSPPTTPSFPIIVSGIYWAYLGENIGSEQNKHRPILVIRSSKSSDLCIAIPLSTQHRNDDNWNHIDLVGYKHTALIEQVLRLSKKRITKPQRVKGRIAEADPKDMDTIYKQLAAYIGSTPSFIKTNL